MSKHDLHPLLALAINDVLETMFFSESLGPGQPDSTSSNLEAEVAFSGEASGTVRVRISETSARNLTASFLGEAEDSLSEIQIADVVRELTNMLCGCIVSKMSSQSCFDLSSPELGRDASADPKHIGQIQQSFAIERGTLTVSLTSNESA